MNTVLRCRSLSPAVVLGQFIKGIDTEEVDGSNPFGPTIFFNHLEASVRLRHGFLPVIPYLCPPRDFHIPNLGRNQY